MIIGLLPATLHAQAADAIVGEWLTESGPKGYARVRISKAGDGTYVGHIIWLSQPNTAAGTPKLDAENDNPKLRTRPVVGLQILSGLRYDADDKEWQDGSIYDPESGNEYSCYFERLADGRLRLRGYLGVSLIGRTSYFRKG
jgi:uncharacterized protein (DUF2147 family)